MKGTGNGICLKNFNFSDPSGEIIHERHSSLADMLKNGTYWKTSNGEN